MDLPLPPSPLVLSRNAGEEELDKRHFDRLRWRCRRGLLELDMVFKNFLEQTYPSLSMAERETFDELLTVQDNTLWAYIQGSENPPTEELRQLVSKIRN
jgi:antitoxin CptB